MMQPKLSVGIPEGCHGDIFHAAEEGTFQLETPRVILTQDDFDGLTIDSHSFGDILFVEGTIINDGQVTFIEDSLGEVVVLHGSDNLWYGDMSSASVEYGMEMQIDDVIEIPFKISFTRMEKVTGTDV